MKIKEILDKSVQFLKDKNFETPRLDAELLISGALNLKRIDLYVKFDQPLNENELESCRQVLRRRIAGEPVAYILGEKDFYGFTFVVNKNVLIPRPDTELVVEEAVQWCRVNNTNSPVILDLGCGSGCIGLSILKVLDNPESKLIAVDISNDAIAVATLNKQKLELNNEVQYYNIDICNIETINSLNLSNLKFDIIVGNPPYISKSDTQVEEAVVKFEPNIALFSEDNGLNDLQMWSKNTLKLLKDKSIMIFEMGYNQGPHMKHYFESLNVFQNVSVKKDLSKHDRVIIGEKNG